MGWFVATSVCVMPTMRFPSHLISSMGQLLVQVFFVVLPGCLVMLLLLAPAPPAWALAVPSYVPVPSFAVVPVADVSSTQANSGQSIHVVGRLAMNLSAPQLRQFEQKTVALATISRAEDGVIAYSCNRDIETAGTYVFDEIWPSQMALEDHLKTDHFRAWWDWVEPHLARELDVEVAFLDAFHRL